MSRTGPRSRTGVLEVQAARSANNGKENVSVKHRPLKVLSEQVSQSGVFTVSQMDFGIWKQFIYLLKGYWEGPRFAEKPENLTQELGWGRNRPGEPARWFS